MLRVGEAAGPEAVSIFDDRGSSQRIVVRTAQIAVTGSKIEVSIDESRRPVLRRLFAADERKYVDYGSRCEGTIQESNPSFGLIIFQFRRASRARGTLR